MRVLEGMAHIALSAMFTAVSNLFISICPQVRNSWFEYRYRLHCHAGFANLVCVTTYLSAATCNHETSFFPWNHPHRCHSAYCSKGITNSGTRLEDDLRLVFALGVGAVVLALSTLSIIRFYRQNLTMLVQTVYCFSILIPVLFGASGTPPLEM